LPDNIDDEVYEADGLRANGDCFTVEVIDRPRSDAVVIAQECANRWERLVNLYRVPYVNMDADP
jgi:hypothetical protein